MFHKLINWIPNPWSLKKLARQILTKETIIIGIPNVENDRLPLFKQERTGEGLYKYI
jgi:hypothetical protein